MSAQTIFATQHNSLIRIGVTREAGNDGGMGLVVSVYKTGSPVRRYRYWHPLDVTHWFRANSLKNSAGWRQAFHKSGFTHADFSRPSGSTNDTETEIDYRAVEYHSQRDNQRYPSGTCNVTSFATWFELFDIKPIETDYKQIEDNLEAYMREKGLSRHSHSDLEKMARAHGADAEFKTGVSLNDIRVALVEGIGVIVSGQFTSAGHIICIIGTKGRDFICHDPWGNYNTRYRDHNGAHVVYTEETLQNVLIDKREGKGPIWAHFIRGKKA